MVGLFAASFFGLVPSFLPPTPCVRGTPCAACHSQRSPNRDSRAWWRLRTGSAAWAARRGAASFFPFFVGFFLFFFPDACADCETHHLRIPTPAPIRRPVAVPRSCSLSVYMGHCCCKQRKMPSQQEHLCHTKKGGGQEIDGVALSHRLRQSHILSGA